MALVLPTDLKLIDGVTEWPMIKVFIDYFNDKI
jgi:hypothetical protein